MLFNTILFYAFWEPDPVSKKYGFVSGFNIYRWKDCYCLWLPDSYWYRSARGEAGQPGGAQAQPGSLQFRPGSISIYIRSAVLVNETVDKQYFLAEISICCPINNY